MEIRDIYTHASRPELLRSGAVSNPASDAALSAAATVEQAPSGRDRVEISEAARAAAGDLRAREFDFARKALLGIPPLDQDRALDILKRIQEGYYSQPEVIKQYASRLAAELIGLPTN